MDYYYTTMILINLALIYDLSHYPWKLFLFFGTVSYTHYCIFQLYPNHKWEIWKIGWIGLWGDVLQYISGTHFGSHRIGWISPKKTYEGYAFGYLGVILCFIYFYSIWDITLYYMLGIGGGLVSSYVKRCHGIKDYSTLLGPHGGWIDRIDSLIFPIIYFYQMQI